MILVTGATGLVGSHLLYQLCQAEKLVCAIKRDRSNINFVKKVFSYYCDDYSNLFQKIKWIDADILDLPSLEDAFKGVTSVYHCAAWISFNPKHKQKMIQNNVEGTANIVNLCLAHNINKLCHVSSVASIGRAPKNQPINEDTLWSENPLNSAYSISKYKSEIEVWRGVEEGLNAVIVNPAIILGPGKWEKGSSLIFKQIWNGMPFYTSGSSGFVDVRDVAKIMIQLMNSSICAERFILSSESIPFKTTFDYIANQLGRKNAHIKIGPFLSSVGWRLAKIFSFFTGKGPVFTKETAIAGSSISIYDSEKVSKQLGFKFKKVKKSCEEFSDLFLREIAKPFKEG